MDTHPSCYGHAAVPHGQRESSHYKAQDIYARALSNTWRRGWAGRLQTLLRPVGCRVTYYNNIMYEKGKKSSVMIRGKKDNPILHSTFRALGWNAGQGTLQTLLQPVRLLCHSHRGPKSAYGGLPGFIQDGGYSREEPERPLSHICPGPCAVFSCGCQRGYR